MHLEKAYFHECLQSKDDPCPLAPAIAQKLDEIRQYRGEALLGHLNISINLMIKPAPGNWVGPFEAVTMKNGDCKSYSLAKYAAAQEVGISPDHVRLVIVHLRARNEDHMVVAVFQMENGSFLTTGRMCWIGIGKNQITSRWLFWITRGSGAMLLLSEWHRGPHPSDDGAAPERA